MGRRNLVLSLALLSCIFLSACGSSGNSSGNSSPAPSPDFALSVPAVTVTPNSTQTITISIAPENGFSSSVNVSISGLPAGVTASPSSFILTLAGSSYPAATVTITASSNAAPGVVAMTVAAVSGSISHTVATTTGAPDFAFTEPASPITLTAGSTAQVSISVDPFNGFNGQVSASLSGFPAGVTASPSSLTLLPGTAQTVTLAAAATVAAGSATLTVAGTSGSLTHNLEIPLALTVPPPDDFSLTLSPNPASIALPIGGTQQATVTANAVGVFNSPVSVTVAGIPAGVTATPSSFSLTPGSTQTVVFQASDSAVAGETSVTFQGSAGALSHSVALSLTVSAPAPDFELFAGPSTLDLSTIGSQPLTIALTPLNGFNSPATVTISGLPAGVALLNSPLPLVANIAQSIAFSAINASAGQATVTVTATAGAITHTAQVDLVISTSTADFTPLIGATLADGGIKPLAGLLLTPGNFPLSILAGPGITVQLSGLVPGTGLNQSQYTFVAGANGVAGEGLFNLTVTPQAVGERGVLTAIFTGRQINHEIDLPIYVVAQPEIFSYVAPLTMSPGSAADLLYEVTSTSINEEALYLGSGFPQNFWLNPYLTDMNPSLIANSNYFYVELPGPYSVSAGSETAVGPTTLPLLFAVDALSQTVAAPMQVSSSTDFQITAEPTTIALGSGATQTVSISASAVDGSTAPVNVSLDQLPAGLQASPQQFSIAPGSTETVTLTAGSNYATEGVINVDATSGSLNHSTQIAVSPGSPGSFTGDLSVGGNSFSGLGIAKINTSGSYTAITPGIPGGITAVLGFVPTVGAVDQPPPYISNCGSGLPNCTPVDVELYVAPMDLYDSNLLGSPQPGTLVLDANLGGGDQLAILPYLNTPPDFTLAFSPTSLTIPAGSSASLSITGTSTSPSIPDYCGLNSTATYKAQVNAPAPLVSSLVLSLCPSQSVVASISVPLNVPPGNYELTVNSSLYVAYQPFDYPQAATQTSTTIYAGHSYGVPVTVTSALPGFQLSASPGVIELAPGQSFPITVSATGTNGFTGSISVTASTLPQGVTISPQSFSVDAGSSQPVTVSVAAGTPNGGGIITLTGTSGSVTESTGISVTVSSSP